MNIKKLDSIIRSVSDSNINEIKIEGKNVKLKFVNGNGFKSAIKKSVKVQHSDDDIPLMDNINPESISGTSFINDSREINENDICSDTIGYFTRFNKATKKQYIKLRDSVKEGDIVGIVTAMHVEHEILADKSGKVKEVLVEEGQPVEYGQPLIRLEK